MSKSNEKSVCQCDADWTDGTPYCQQCGLERAPSVEPAAQPQTIRSGFGEFDLSTLAEDECVMASGLRDGGWVVVKKEEFEAARASGTGQDARTLLDMAANKLESSEYPSDLHLAATIRKHLAVRASGTVRETYGINLPCGHKQPSYPCSNCFSRLVSMTGRMDGIILPKAQLISKDAASSGAAAPPKEK